MIGTEDTLKGIKKRITFIEWKLDLLMKNVCVLGENYTVYDLWKRGGKDAKNSDSQKENQP